MKEFDVKAKKIYMIIFFLFGCYITYDLLFNTELELATYITLLICWCLELFISLKCKKDYLTIAEDKLIVHKMFSAKEYNIQDIDLVKYHEVRGEMIFRIEIEGKKIGEFSDHEKNGIQCAEYLEETGVEFVEKGFFF
ncbi:MAG: hypothetical protein Q4D45_03360 [Lachnospiraceae bacterium]|nr:hypothetical protein [Lachnospiraceae bacterium]